MPFPNHVVSHLNHAHHFTVIKESLSVCPILLSLAILTVKINEREEKDRFQ